MSHLCSAVWWLWSWGVVSRNYPSRNSSQNQSVDKPWETWRQLKKKQQLLLIYNHMKARNIHRSCSDVYRLFMHVFFIHFGFEYPAPADPIYSFWLVSRCHYHCTRGLFSQYIWISKANANNRIDVFLWLFSASGERSEEEPEQCRGWTAQIFPPDARSTNICTAGVSFLKCSHVVANIYACVCVLVLCLCWQPLRAQRVHRCYMINITHVWSSWHILIKMLTHFLSRLIKHLFIAWFIIK